MNVHQVLTGALNSNSCSFSVGSVEGNKFIVCGVGVKVVILTSNFTRIQVINCNQSDCLVRALNCCSDTGKIAVAYGSKVRIFEPTSTTDGKIFPYTWAETQSIQTDKPVNYLEWVLEGLRLLVQCDKTLFLYQHKLLSTVVNLSTASKHVAFSINDDFSSAHVEEHWERLWSTELSSKPKYVKFSSDSTIFATCGENDRFVKIWYPNEHTQRSGQCEFSYIYLQHPGEVYGFEWRRTGKYVPRKCVSNVLITWCSDNTSRIWKQIPSTNDTVEQLLTAVQAVQQDKPSRKKAAAKHNNTLKKARTRLISKINKMMHNKNQSPTIPRVKFSMINRNATFADFANPVHSHNVSFSLATTINAENDCFLVPSMDGRDTQRSSAFAVHWLNNKEMLFTHGAEKILAEAIFRESSDSGQRSGTASEMTSPVASHEGTPGLPDNISLTHQPEGSIGTVSNGSTALSTELDAAKDVLDVKIEGLIQQWNKSTDILFAVHPIDGSLLTWMVEGLDDEWRQSVVSFASRSPSAFPLTDAASLNLGLCVFSPHEANFTDFHRHSAESFSDAFQSVSLLTSHKNGSLNLWQLCMEDNKLYNNIVNVIHRYRMCGHRFRTKNVSPHPILPLLLTSSSLPALDSSPGESELILWKVNHVGPLCQSGGIRELSRITTVKEFAFKCLSWVPAIIPSFANGTVFNSPSSCFITSRNDQLSLYQAVLDARGLLNELFCGSRPASQASSVSSDDEYEAPTKQHVKLDEMFTVVSTQSTGKPGCMIYLGDLEDSNVGSDEILLLHVFNEDLLSDFDTDKREDSALKFFIILLQRDRSGKIKMKMWSLLILIEKPVPINLCDEDKRFRRFSVGGPEFLATAADVTPTAAQLTVKTKKVYDDFLSIPSGVTVNEVVTCAGHLPSSSVYPACRTPYLILLSCSDNKVRFLRCTQNKGSENSINHRWEAWGMINGATDSSLSIHGDVCCMTSAHSGRFACVYKPFSSSTPIDMLSYFKDIHIAIYECETSGGVEWLQEKNVRLESTLSAERKLLDTKIWCNDEIDLDEAKNLVRVDWASKEDGGHILTVGVGNLIFFFAQASLNKAQQNVAVMQEESRPQLRRDSSLASNVMPAKSGLSEWICIRYIALESVDGLAPLPTLMSWLRDGLFVVGMPSEIRVYSQWNMVPLKSAPQHNTLEPMKNGAATKTVKILGIRPVASVSNLSASQSHLMLDQLMKKTKVDSHILNKNDQPKTLNSLQYVDTLIDEGIFEAARLSNPMLPQYHPKQLIEMLNAGKTKRVKAILLHVLKALKQYQMINKTKLARGASIRFNTSKDGEGNTKNDLTKQKSVNVIDDEEMEYEELESIAPLPLYALLEMDEKIDGDEKAANIDGTKDVYDTLFNGEESDEDLDDVLESIQKTETRSRSSRSRHSSTCSDGKVAQNSFTSRHSRALTEMLTHTHLPGLSSVDQMHLLAVADTLSQFSPSVMDKLVQVNAPLKPEQKSSLIDTAASGYASSSTGIETVDECGLRFLMAMKQHDYLLLCLPRGQRQKLRVQGMPISQVIWAFHSDAENELLSTIPCYQKGQETWDGLRSYGVAWWLKNNTTLRLIMEKVAKAAFQAQQEPMDAALFYLAMRKKNVLTHLFKTVGDQRMHDFFREDFSQQKWKKAALKNAFVLMSKQRYQNAAAFFLLGDSLNDAIETILSRLKDLQLAMVVVRLYETDQDKQAQLMENMLCKNIFRLNPSELHELSKKDMSQAISRFPKAETDPFERSMALWMIKEYALAAAVLVEEAAQGSVTESETSLSDIFNFYTFLRRNPLVIRQRITNAGVQVATTEKFLAFSRHLENRVTTHERRLYFRTAALHLASGCPLLALDVLSVLPRRIIYNVSSLGKEIGTDTTISEEPKVDEKNTVDALDWSAPTNVVKDDELELDWGDDEAEEEVDDFKEEVTPTESEGKPAIDDQIAQFGKDTDGNATDSLDFIAQHMKFVAALKMMADELSTLASGAEVDGGELRHEMMNWLAKECSILKDVCDYSVDSNIDEDNPFVDTVTRRKWLLSNQKLIRTFTSYCILHSAQNHRLTSVLMELILLLLEVQQETNGYSQLEVVQTKAFPLFNASISACRMFVSSPLNFLEDQCTDLLSTISKLRRPPPFSTPFSMIRKIYNLCQGLSSCLYQSLSSADDFEKHYQAYEDLKVQTTPNSWPGVDSLVALLSAGKDEEAPNLRLLLVKVFFSVSTSLFCYAMANYDPRWLYRLCIKEVDSVAYGYIFGGGGEKIVPCSTQPPARPPPPPRPPQPGSAEKARTSFHAKVLGVNEVTKQPMTKQVLSCWVPPKKSLVQFFAEKVAPDPKAPNEVVFDSDQSESDLSDDEDQFDINLEVMTRPHKDPNSYAWLLIRFSCVLQQIERLKNFLQVAGFEIQELVRLSPQINNVLKLYTRWSNQLQTQIQNYPDGCPLAFLPNMYILDENTPLTVSSTLTDSSSLLKKYKSLVESNNTPFEYSGKGVLAVKRLWSYLVRQENLSSHFVRYIYSGAYHVSGKEKITLGSITTNSQNGKEYNEPIRLMQREREAIVTFSCCNVRPGHIVVATNREVQELNIDRVLCEKENNHEINSLGNFLNNRVDLDIALGETPQDRLKDNDDYQLMGSNKATMSSSSFLTPFIIDRSRVALKKLKKRNLPGVRRIESHPSFPYYVTGASDGSIYMWEWNVDQPIFTARQAAQFAKVTKLSFAQNGNKFASVDGDGHLCIWQATQQTSSKKPFFNQKCHTKSASDVKFLGQTSSVLVTAGQSQGDMNIALWDTLLPNGRNMVYAFNGHLDGATCVSYFSSSQTIVSGGRHGEICLWDLRQRQLRATVKAFDSAGVRSMYSDNNSNILLTGSSEGDIKIWDINSVPQLLHTLSGEHTMKGGFSLRQVGSSTVQGTQQLYFDSDLRLFSCGADCSLKIRTLPNF
ncbi:unnamed protein product [Bursaphelenchus okinawaensis]|uniref:RAVE complex protein Rav1 C-terminal domain-containing protein n=1 Tax=Bursaphelenchus okinawaensis TaxID=465554 RepID=A0A811KHL2_9BILA|nr:unnamed protein product [Bursaphelenchus okinawaensis]CAG9104720.1 unnamed protein product [Bursaphelenchus okinawaensis]